MSASTASTNDAMRRHNSSNSRSEDQQIFADTIPPTVKESKLFEGLDSKVVLEMANSADIKQLPAYTILINEGDDPDHMYLLEQGQAKYYKITKDGDEILLQWMVAGDVCGLGALLRSPRSYVATAETLSDCTIWHWNRSTIRQFATRYPVIIENALHLIRQYLRNYLVTHVLLTEAPAEPRLAEALLTLADQTGQISSNGVEVKVTNEQLGGMAHISPFTVSRLLNRWQRSGVISKERKRVLVHNPEALMVG